MKHLLILFLSLGSFLFAENQTGKKSSQGFDLDAFVDEALAYLDPQEVTLDTKLITADKKVSSLYVNQNKVANSQQITSHPDTTSSITFYVDVDKMLGGKKLKKNRTYRLDSISWYGHPSGEYSGFGRKVIISNGDESMIRPLPETKKPKITVHRKDDSDGLTFTRDDILEVSIMWQGDKRQACSVRCYDAPPAPAVIRGTAFNLTDKGELPSGTGVDNKYIRSWRFNCPAVRIRATAVQEYNAKTLALGALAILGLILIIKLLFGSKKD